MTVPGLVSKPETTTKFKPFVVAGGPIRNREEVVGDHVLALDKAGVDAFLYVLGTCIDNTPTLLHLALQETGKPGVIVHRSDPEGVGWDRGYEGRPRYDMVNVAKARQRWVNEVMTNFPTATHLWSCDSDIIVAPECLTRLLAGGAPDTLMIGANVRLSPGAWNFMLGLNDNDVPVRNGHEGEATNAANPIPVTWTGSCVLYARKLFETVEEGGLGARYDVGDPSRFEEAGIMETLRAKDRCAWWAARARTEHRTAVLVPGVSG